MYSEIERTRKLGSGVDDFRLDDVVKDGVDACRWDEGGSANSILSREVFGADGLLEYTGLASTLKDVLGGTEQRSFSRTCSSEVLYIESKGDLPWKSPAKEENPVTYLLILGQKARAHWMLMFP